MTDPKTSTFLTPEEEAALGDPTINRPRDPTEMMLQVTGAELAIILQGLDEGPRKITNRVYEKIQRQVGEFVMAVRRARAVQAKQEALLKAAEGRLVAANPPPPPNANGVAPIDSGVAAALADAQPPGAPG